MFKDIQNTHMNHDHFYLKKK